MIGLSVSMCFDAELTQEHGCDEAVSFYSSKSKDRTVNEQMHIINQNCVVM